MGLGPSALVGSDIVGFIRLLRVCRCVSPVRIVNKIKPLKRVLNAVTESWSAITNVILIIVGMWILFSHWYDYLRGLLFVLFDPDFPDGTHRDQNISGFPRGCTGTYIDSVSGKG